MSRQLATSLIFLVSLATIPACQRQQALVQSSVPYWHEPTAVAQPMVENVYANALELKEIPQRSEYLDEVVAHNSSQPATPQTLRKRVVQIQRILRIAERQFPLVTSVLPIRTPEQGLSTRNARQLNYLPRLGMSEIGSLLLLGGVAMMLVGLKFSMFLMVTGLLAAGVGAVLSTIGRFTGR